MSTIFDHDFYVADGEGLEFLADVQSTDGDITVGDSTAVGEFNAATAAALSTMRAEAIAFWTTGVADVGTTASITGFSTTTPRDYFDAFRSDQASTGTWLGTGALSLRWGQAIRAAYYAGTAAYKALGVSIWAWLMTFTDNPAFNTSSSASPGDVAAGQTGTWDPTLALTTSIDTTNKTNASSLYDWECAGFMAAVQSAQAPAKLRAVKEAIYQPQPLYVEPTSRAGEVDYIPLRGRSGLSFQMSFTDSGHRTWDAKATARIMDIYRHAPQVRNGLDRAS